jgi:hypothetical protein
MFLRHGPTIELMRPKNPVSLERPASSLDLNPVEAISSWRVRQYVDGLRAPECESSHNAALRELR